MNDYNKIEMAKMLSFRGCFALIVICTTLITCEAVDPSHGGGYEAWTIASDPICQ